MCSATILYAPGSPLPDRAVIRRFCVALTNQLSPPLVHHALSMCSVLPPTLLCRASVQVSPTGRSETSDTRRLSSDCGLERLHIPHSQAFLGALAVTLEKEEGGYGLTSNHYSLPPPPMPARSMDNCALPMELCERVIDALYSDGDDDFRYSCFRWLRSVSYPAWCQTSLVCFAWLKRSQFNLFYEVRLQNCSQLYLLLRTLSKTPSLADLILGFTLDPYWEPWRSETYVPFAAALLTRLLSKCISLRLTKNLCWYNYPPRYADLAFCHWQGRKITHLSVCISTRNCAATFRLIRSLPLLRELVLDLEPLNGFQDPDPEVLSKQLTCIHNSRKAYPLESLRSLELGVCLYSHDVAMEDTS